MEGDLNMTEFWIGLVIGMTFGLALAVLLTRAAGSVRWIAGLFGFSDDRRTIKQLERRLADKDRYIKRAIDAFKSESGKGLESLTEEDESQSPG
jgi:hypothetical protein